MTARQKQLQVASKRPVMIGMVLSHNLTLSNDGDNDECIVDDDRVDEEKDKVYTYK